ncbi:MAG: nucleotidyltransferase domain-containing protein [Actinomycetota bacterium]
MSATRDRERLVDDLLEAVTGWATARSDVRAVGVAGSWARGEARPDSDVDLVVLVDDPKSVFASEGQDIAHEFGVDGRVVIEDWGAVTAIRGYSPDGLEIEIGITTPAWASVDPLDAGTREVIRGGFRIVYDPEGLLAAAVAAAKDA